jgi:hypothetical protein
MNFKNSQRSIWGRWAEDAASRFLTSEGWYITQTCKIENGGAPKAIGAIRSHVLPDILASKDGMSRWGEIKFKDSPGYFRARKEYRHGVELPNWNDYLQVEKETGIPGDLFILEWRQSENNEPSPVLLVISFREARNVPVQEIPPNVQRWAPRGMIFWARNSFQLICRFTLEGFPNVNTVKDQLRQWREDEQERAIVDGFLLPKPQRKWGGLR